ncbi:hypothetical protein [Actinotalea sp. Marseille-Q4924]|uniref:hypothetical protein n=1 Tax=Actinotalea sp. Marseille-Q4924 TaxID=2866571 RepID=UPI001CE43EA0|nr:hypothetical protein [Actinotalea sp. Marseille-Q4924]
MGATTEDGDPGHRPPVAAARRGALAGSLAVALVAGCGTGDLPPTPDGVVGTVWSVSDVSGTRDTRVPEGWVVALPAERLRDLLDVAGDGHMERDLPYLQLTVPAGTLDTLGGTVVEVDGRGRFRVDVTGDTVLCRLPEHPSGRPTTLRGCDRADLAGGTVVRMTWGEGGLAVVPVDG